MDSQYTIKLPTKKGDVEFEVRRPTVLAKRTYYKESQALNAISLRSQSVSIERDLLLKKISDALEKGEETESLLKRSEAISEKLVEINDKAYEISNRRAFAILTPKDGKSVAFGDIEWDNADDSLLDEAGGFFSSQSSKTTTSTNEPEPTTSAS